MNADARGAYAEKLMELLEVGIDETISLISVSIGPVQEYIAEGRKIRDLWIGSYLLASCSYRVLKVFTDKYNNPDVVIHPCVEKTPLYQHSMSKSSFPPSKLQIPTIPNHFVAVFKETDIAEILKLMKSSFGTFWDEIATIAHSRIQGLVGSKYTGWDSKWKDHVSDAFSLMWVYIPTTIKDITNNYQEVYRTLQRAMEERKLTRNFRQHTGSKAVKCQQCGRREVIGPINHVDNAVFFKELRKRLPAACLKDGERICAVCIIKRIIEEGNIVRDLQRVRFDSTSDIASTIFREKLKEMAHGNDQNALNYIQSLKELGKTLGIGEIDSFDDVPGDLFYDEGLQLRALKKDYMVTEGSALSDMAKTTASALRNIKDSGVVLPKYYGILLLDGDHLGKAMSNTNTLDDQRVLSGKISDLAHDKLPQCVDKWRGQTIYSGGDDILAIGPLTGCLSVLEELRTCYQSEMGNGKQCSASLVVAHHQDSLRNALYALREGLNKAKEGYGRNAIVATVILSSGNIMTAGCKWELPHEGVGLSFVEAIKSFTFAMGPQGLTSPRFAYDLLKVLPTFYYRNNNGTVRSLSKELFTHEVNRIAVRHTKNNHACGAYGPKKIGPQEIEVLFKLSDPAFWQRSLNVANVDVIENMSALLRIIAFLARENMEVL